MSEFFAHVKATLAEVYEVEKEIGEGGMAIVFLATDRKHGRKVAIKVMRPELAESLGGDRFLKEIETAARLSHPHILPVHDSGQANGLLYYVMPFVEGESLSDRLTREQQLPIDDALAIAKEVAEALAHAHAVFQFVRRPRNADALGLRVTGDWLSLNSRRISSCATPSPRASDARARSRAAAVSGVMSFSSTEAPASERANGSTITSSRFRTTLTLSA